ncbi:MAG: dihydroorotate dehydrogenase electron transfer subunit [Acidobacteriota bacterium]|nr:dihydroorotate dehydrogenase electron transfer subunit [Acidobacteriota bacterium]
MRHDAGARILEKQSWGDYHLLRFESPAMAAEAGPGQFVMIRTNPGGDPLLRRPLGIHDAGDGRLEVFFRTAGRGTALLAAKKEGETLDVIGPLGKGFRLDGPWKGQAAWLVGGGRGIAPLYFLGRGLKAKGARVKVFYGGKTAAEVPIADKFKAAGLHPAVATDDGSLGFKGFVTALLKRELADGAPRELFVCGPDPMMERTAAMALSRGLPAQISLEAIMGCGFGACWGCVHRIREDGRGHWRKICEDGPVFAADEIIWGEG